MSDTPIYEDLVRDVQQRSSRRVDVVLAYARSQVAAAERWASEQTAAAWRAAELRVAVARRRSADLAQRAEQTSRVRDALVVDLRDQDDPDGPDGTDDRPPPPVPSVAALMSATRGTARHLDALFGGS